MRGTPSIAALVALLGFGVTAHAEDLDVPAMADAYFATVYGFDGLEAYESRFGRVSTGYAVSRKWVDGRAKVLVDFLTPRRSSRVALLLLRQSARADDVFVYLPSARRVFRLPPSVLQEPRVFNLISLGELRPVAPGELEYERLPDEDVEGEVCVVVLGRTRVRGLGFDRIELALARDSGLALRIRTFSGTRELRTVLVAPEDYREYEGRRLPWRRRIVDLPNQPPTEVLLRNIVVDTPLPDALFTRHNLKVQRFPSF